jgi:hypothetical protein
MRDNALRESKRRSLVKTILWRITGIIWTWIGAYLILLLIPPSRQTAAFLATLIVVYHHSTRMIMYYFYERIWAAVAWGRREPPRPMSRRARIVWTAATLASLAVILYLIIYVTPRIKPEPPVKATAEQTAHSRPGGPGATPDR